MVKLDYPGRTESGGWQYQRCTPKDVAETPGKLWLKRTLPVTREADILSAWAKVHEAFEREIAEAHALAKKEADALSGGLTSRSYTRSRPGRSSVAALILIATASPSSPWLHWHQGASVPHLSFETFRLLADPDTAEGLTRAVTMIPALGEFTCATQALRKSDGGATSSTRSGPGTTTPRCLRRQASLP